MLHKIPTYRLIIYIALIVIVPIASAFYLFSAKKREWQEIREQIDTCYFLERKQEQKQRINQLVCRHYRKTDDFYLEKSLESLNLLQKEQTALEILFEKNSFIGHEKAESRYTFLTSGENRLNLQECEVHHDQHIHEALYNLQRAVEVDTQDIENILSLIEDTHPHKPQLFLHEFVLQRKKTLLEDEVYELNLKLCKREYR